VLLQSLASFSLELEANVTAFYDFLQCEFVSFQLLSDCLSLTWDISLRLLSLELEITAFDTGGVDQVLCARSCFSVV
jgi:hypothetical protein